MLFKDPFIIAPHTFQLIQKLQSIPEFSSFVLVGGTSLALQLGHRNSIDIDLFSKEGFTVDLVVEALQDKHTFESTLLRENTILAVIDNVKTDFIRHNYPYVLPPITEEGITYLSKEDISAMKLHAIVQSGKRLKDFIDIYFLLEHFCINEMMEFFVKKYSYSNPMIALKALGYFDDIDENIDPPKLLKPLPLDKIKKRILKAIEKPFVSF